MFGRFTHCVLNSPDFQKALFIFRKLRLWNYRNWICNILAFEKELARRRLSGCYTAADAEAYADGSFDWLKEPLL